MGDLLLQQRLGDGTTSGLIMSPGFTRTVLAKRGLAPELVDRLMSMGEENSVTYTVPADPGDEALGFEGHPAMECTLWVTPHKVEARAFPAATTPRARPSSKAQPVSDRADVSRNRCDGPEAETVRSLVNRTCKWCGNSLKEGADSRMEFCRGACRTADYRHRRKASPGNVRTEMLSLADQAQLLAGHAMRSPDRNEGLYCAELLRRIAEKLRGTVGMLDPADLFSSDDERPS